MALTKRQKAKIDAYRLTPSREVMDSFMRKIADDPTVVIDGIGRVDYELAPIMTEKLTSTQAQIQETTYPEYLAANGMILPIDSSDGPEAERWRYWRVDFAGRCDWIDEGGMYSPTSALSQRKFEGQFARFGHRWETTIFDLARAAAADVPLDSFKGKLSKKAHEAWKDWHWCCGSIGHELEGLLTNPNITHLLAPFDSASGNTTRLWAGKSDDDIFADVKTVIDRVPIDTHSAEYVADVYLPLGLVQEAQGRYLSGTATGVITLWDKITAAWGKKDNVTGQPPVNFHVWNMMDADLRIDPASVEAEAESGSIGGTDTALSGFGDLMLAMPPKDASTDAFKLAYPMRQEAPARDPESFRIITKTHERMGGCKLQRPKGYVLMRFGTT